MDRVRGLGDGVVMGVPMSGKVLLGRLALATALVAGCGDGGHGPSDGDEVRPVDPMPSGLTGKVAFVTSRVVTSGAASRIDSRIHVIDIAAPADRVIYTGQGMQIQDLTWAPDGARLVMQSYIAQPPGPNGENRDIVQLHELDLAGTRDVVLFDGQGPEFHPEYALDGRLAYFARWSTDPAAGIHISGTATYPMYFDGNTYLAWAPDGHALAFTKFGLQRLSLPEETVTLLVPAENDETITQPSYSPDGSRIAFMRFAGGRDNQEIWTTDSSGGDPRRLTHGFADGAPAWTPGGSYIAFWRFGGTGQGIYVMPPDGGTPERIVAVGTSGAGVMDWSR